MMKKTLAFAAGLMLSCTAFAADISINSLPTAATLNSADTLPVVQSGSTRKASVNQVIAAVQAAMAPVAVSGSASDLNSGTLPAGRLPALTGAVTTSAGSTVTAIAAGAVTDAQASLAVKPAIRAVATANQALSGLPTLDGQTLTDGDLALLTGQTAGSQNGPWVVHSGSWTRPGWYASGNTTQAFQFVTTFVRLGTLYQGTTWRQTAAAPITIDTTATTWTETPLALNSSSVTGQIPALANLPTITNGVLLGNAGVGPAAPSELSAIPSGITADASLLTTGTLSAALIPGSPTRYGTATTLALVSTDNGSVVAQSNASAVAATLPQIGTSSITAGAFQVILLNQGAGTVTVTPTTSTINGASTLVIPQGQGCFIAADNTTSPGNYNSLCGYPTTIPASSLIGGTISSSTAWIFNTASLAAVGYAVTGSACGNATTARSNSPGGSGSSTYGICTNGNQAVSWDTNAVQALLAPLADASSAPTITKTAGAGSCVVSTVTGGMSAGSFVLASGTGACTFTISGLPGTHLVAGVATANHGWRCTGGDIISGAGLVQLGALSATSCSISGTIATATDTVAYGPLEAF